jgi:hypothetical protein
MNQLTQFLQEIDEAVRRIARPDERLTLYQIGRMTLIQHFGLRSATNDFDVLQQRDSPLSAHALTLFGKDAERAVRLGIYLEAVPEGLPPTPQKYRSNSVIVPGP